jgi:GDP-L-fucose synthase
MTPHSRIFIAGHRGMVGSAIYRALEKTHHRLVVVPRRKLNLLDAQAVDQFFHYYKPEYVFMAAAKVGGIMANQTQPAEFIYENLAVQTNVIHSAWQHGVKKLLFLGSSCIFPRECPQPIKEEYLLTSPLEPTNEPYAIAKIAGLKMIESYRRQYGVDFISVMPTNLYGSGDHYDLRTSHVLPALIRKFHEAKETNAEQVTLWGTGCVRREFMHVDDLADACLFLMQRYSSHLPINIGTGTDLTIRELAEMIVKLVGYEGTISWDSSKPDGTPRKLLDVSRLRTLGWSHTISLAAGLERTYADFLLTRKNA